MAKVAMATTAMECDEECDSSIVFTCHPSEGLHPSARLPGLPLLPESMRTLIDAHLPKHFWKAALHALHAAAGSRVASQLKARLVRRQRSQSQSQSQSQYTVGAFTALCASACMTTVLDMPAGIEDCSLGALLFSFIDTLLERKQYPQTTSAHCESPRFANVRDGINDASAARAHHALLHLYARVGLSPFVAGVDRAWFANQLEFAAEHIFGHIATAAGPVAAAARQFRGSVVPVCALLRASDVYPIIVSHSEDRLHRSPLDWHESWTLEAHDWLRTVEAVDTVSPDAARRLGGLDSSVRRHLASAFFDDFMNTLGQGERFLICSAMRRSFGTALRIGPIAADCLFTICGGGGGGGGPIVVDRGVLGRFCAHALASVQLSS
jgi:hypothetical protein